jgi:rubrerythrin
MASFRLEAIPWHQLDRSKVDPNHLMLARTASLVEYNSGDYTAYLENVFADDPEFRAAIVRWGDEERQHGLALKAWIEHVDPSFDFEKAVERFRAAYRIPVEATESVRGSRGRELIARCVVESGTSSFYSALANATQEPVLKRICRWIAQDEVAHFNLFFSHFQRYQRSERIRRLSRLKVVLERILEANDEELCFAYAAAHGDGPVDPGDLGRFRKEYFARALAVYQPRTLRLGIGLAFKASGIPVPARLQDGFARWGSKFCHYSARRHQAALERAGRRLALSSC